MPFDVCSGWKGKTWKLIRFVDLDYHPNVSELISTAAEQEMQEGKKGICLEENTFFIRFKLKMGAFCLERISI